MTLQVLTEDYGPENLLFRGEQSEKIEQVFQEHQKKEDAMPLNIILIGVTGAGKTFTLKRILEKYPNHIYLSASIKRRSNQIISLISGIDVRRTDVLLERTIKELQKNKKVLVIDELNRLEDPKIFFGDLNTIFRQTKIPIILVTNNPFVTNDMEEDAKNTLFLSKVVFTRYSTGELRDICLQRLNLLPPGLAEKIEERTLGYICDWSSRVGSARKALNLVRGCYINNNFSIEYVEQMIEDEECMDFKSFISSMNDVQRQFLIAMIGIQYGKVRRGGEASFTFQDIKNEFPNMHKSKISQLVTVFEEKYNFIRTQYIERGRAGGRHREIRFLNEEILNKIKGVLT